MLNCHLSAQHSSSLSPLVTRRRRRFAPVAYDHWSSDCGVESADVEEEEILLLEDERLRLALEEAHALGGSAEEKFIATSFVAEDIPKNGIEDSASGKRRQLSSVSTALLLTTGIGIFEAVVLSLGSGLFLSLMGVPMTSEMYAPAKQFLLLRSLEAPAVVLSLALQGIFRDFKATKTPVICLGKNMTFT